MKEGRFVTFKAAKPVAETSFPVQVPPGWDRWCAVYRRDSCWMTPQTGSTLEPIPSETQFLLLRYGKTHRLYLPLVTDKHRASLQGNRDTGLEIIVESGCPDTQAETFRSLYTAEGTKPDELVHAAVLALQRRAAQRPRFAEHLGWCSWNAFYEKLTEEKLLQVLQDLQHKGIKPRFAIIDGGWQDTGNRYLNRIHSHPEKFPAGIASTVSTMKEKFGVKDVFLWQTNLGYWCGLNPESFDATRKTRLQVPSRLDTEQARMAAVQETSTGPTDTISDDFYPSNIRTADFHLPENFGTFYKEYHTYMQEAGANALKIDAITWIEGLGAGLGGRVSLMREFLEASISSLNRYFADSVIWCSSCSNDFLQLAPPQGVVRTSIDYFPEKPETHGQHVYANAINSLFAGPFVWPDWDMFQTDMGKVAEFHAAARAISGGPVYTTDAVGQENADLIQRLTLPDGSVPLCQTYARPTTETLYTSPEEVLVVIHNHNKCNAVAGFFHCGWQPDQPRTLTGKLPIESIIDAKNKQLILYRKSTGTFELWSATRSYEVQLGQQEFELVTIISSRNGCAPLGDTSLFNPGGVIHTWQMEGTHVHHFHLLPCRRFDAFLETPPREVWVNGKAESCIHTNGHLRVSLPTATDSIRLTLSLEAKH